VTETLLRLQAVAIGYGQPLMPPVDFELRSGEFWAVAGPNGAGKTTLVKTMLGLLPPLAGCRELRPGLRFGYVPQRHTLNAAYPLTALDVAVMDRTARRGPGRGAAAADHARAAEELTRLGLAESAAQHYGSLSGGQQQRVLLARALAADPDVLILDEPASGIDLLGGADVHALLRREHQRGLTMLMISHSLSEVVGVVDHLCLLNRDTGVFETGPTEEMVTSERLARLFGRPISVHRCAGRLHIDVAEGAA
jgi:ABC-type Mn2+/Zn2+ transport system ATPase subunit